MSGRSHFTDLRKGFLVQSRYYHVVKHKGQQIKLMFHTFIAQLMENSVWNVIKFQHQDIAARRFIRQFNALNNNNNNNNNNNSNNNNQPLLQW